MARIVQFNRLTQAAKLTLIESMVREYDNPETIAPPLPPKVMDELRQTAKQMRLIRNQRIEKTEARQRSTQVYKQSLATLRTRLRHAYQLVKRRANQPDFPKSIVISFGLNSDGTYPKALQQLPEPEQIAKDIVQAEQNALAQGYNVLTDPSAAELSELVETVAKNEAQRSLAITEATQTKDQEHRLIEASDKLIKGIRHYISFALTGESPRRQQKVLEALGFTYTGKQNPEEPNSTGTTISFHGQNAFGPLHDGTPNEAAAIPKTEPDCTDRVYPCQFAYANLEPPTKQPPSNAGTPMPLQGLDSSSPIHDPDQTQEHQTKQGPSNTGTPMPLQGLDSSSPIHAFNPCQSGTPNEATAIPETQPDCTDRVYPCQFAHANLEQPPINTTPRHKRRIQ